MEPNAPLIEPLIERIEQYGKTSAELVKLRVIHKSALIMSEFIFRTVILIVLSLFLIFVTVGVSLWLGEIMGKTYYGFFCVSVFYLIIGAILYVFFRTSIKKHIANIVIYKSLN